MFAAHRAARRAALFALVVGATAIVAAQAPLPLRGQAGQGQGQGGAGGRGGGGRGQAPALPAAPVVSPLASATPEVTAPGEMFPAFMSLPAGDDFAHYKYEAHEYFVTGTASNQPYKTRVVVRKPADNSKFSGIVVAEAMHPSGNAWMFHFTHTYVMSAGHIGLEIVTSPPGQFQEFNAERYKDMKVEPGQASEILAQVGALVRSTQKDNPLAGLPIRHMILTGTSASSGTLVQYLPSHLVYRLPGMKPIYDGFLPTSNGANIQKVDVPLVQIPTMREVTSNSGPTRQDGDAPGDQYRAYEFSGMAHLDTRNVEAFRPNPCKYPISMYPLGAYMAVGMEHLIAWVDKGTVPPRAERILIDRNTANDGSLMALDERGNPKGGIRNPYVDVPVAKYAVPNEAADPQPAGVVPWVALRGPEGISMLCGLTNYELDFSKDQLKSLYKDKKTYQAKVQQRVDELTKQGWSLPVYRAQILADAAKVDF